MSGSFEIGIMSGKVNDAILMSKGLIDNPQHPKLNHYGRGNSSAAYGRKRLMETLEQFEEWDQILKLTETHYLEPTDNEKLQQKDFYLLDAHILRKTV